LRDGCDPRQGGPRYDSIVILRVLAIDVRPNARTGDERRPRGDGMRAGRRSRAAGARAKYLV